MHAASSSDDGLVASINVTPLVDITLVLLIIFIVTAKIVVQSAVPMNLPTAAAPGAVQTVLSVELFSDGKTLVNSQPITDADAIGPLALAALRADPELRAVIRADRQVPHGRVIQVLDKLKGARVGRIAFATQPAATQSAEGHP